MAGHEKPLKINLRWVHCLPTRQHLPSRFQEEMRAHLCCRPRASLSRRLVRRDLLDLRRERVFGRFEIEARLNVHPERSAGLEELAEPQRGVGLTGFSSRAMRSIRVRGTSSAAATA
jgi:hypothetical protein